jgi:exonuclease III
MEVKISTWNCNGVSGIYPAVEMLCDASDIILLQETWLKEFELDSLNKVHKNYRSKAFSSMDTADIYCRGRPYGGLAVLWNKNVFKRFTDVKLSESKRVMAMTLVGSDQKLRIINVYAPSDNGSRDCREEFLQVWSEVVALADGWKSVIIGGDFNTDYHRIGVYRDVLYEMMSDNNLECLDMVGNFLGRITYVSFINNSKSWLDHFWGSSDIRNRTVSSEVLSHIVGSDHLPLMVKITETNIPHAKTQELNDVVNGKWRINDATKRKCYREEIERNLEHAPWPSCFNCEEKICNDTSHKEDIQGVCRYLTNLMTAVEKTITGNRKAKESKQEIIGWNDLVKEKYRNYQKAYEEWLIKGKAVYSIENDNRKIAHKCFRNALRFCKKNERTIKVKSMILANRRFTPAVFWGKINKERTQRDYGTAVLEEVQGKDGIVKKFKEIFEMRGKSESDDEEPNDDEGQPRWLPTEHEVQEVLKGLKKNKSRGLDGLCAENVKDGGTNLWIWVTQLVICSFRHKEVLDASNLTKVIPVIKNKAGSESDSNNYRAISITSIWSKIFDKLVLMKLETVVSVKDNQFGFKKKLSTKMAVKVLEMSVKRNTDKKGSVCAAFIDVEKAFDSVDRNELWRILAERGVDKGVIDMIKIQYKNEVNKVLWDGKYSEVYKVKRGVRQGSALSAFLFSVILESALSDIAMIYPGFSHIGLLTNMIMYADDIVCFALTRNELQNMLNVVAKALIKVGLKINLKKTVCVDFKAKGGVDYGNKKISIGKDTIEWVKSVKYLGIMLTHDMDWNMQMKEIYRTISKQGNGIVMQFKRTLGQEDLYKVLEACAFHMYGVEFCGNVKRSLWHEVAKAYHWIIKKRSWPGATDK